MSNLKMRNNNNHHQFKIKILKLMTKKIMKISNKLKNEFKNQNKS